MTDKQIEDLKPLYKMYSRKNHNFDAIANGNIFLTKLNEFNDAFDGTVGFDYDQFEKKYLLFKFKDNSSYCEAINNNFSSKSALDILIACVDLSPENIEKKFSYLFDKNSNRYRSPINKLKLKKEIEHKYNVYAAELSKIRASYYVACFTETKPEQNVAMWNFYADNYKGFCCEFSLERLKYDVYSSRVKQSDYDYNICQRLIKVCYKPKSISVDIDYLLTIEPEDVYNDEKINRTIYRSLCRKNPSWKNENEWRLIIKEEDSFFQQFGFLKENEKGRVISFNFLKQLYCINIENCCKKKIFEISYNTNTPLCIYDIDKEQSKLVQTKKKWFRYKDYSFYIGYRDKVEKILIDKN